MLTPSTMTVVISPEETLSLCQAEVTSQRLGWSNLILAHRTGLDSNVFYPAVSHHLITCHLDGAQLTRRLPNETNAGCHVPHSITITTANQPSTWDWQGQSNRIDLYLCPSILYAMAEATPITGAYIIPDLFATSDHTIDHIVRGLFTETVHPTFGSKLFADSMAHLLALHLMRLNFQPAFAEPRRKGGLDPVALNRVKDLIEGRLSDDISLDEMAKAANLSIFHFCRSFKQSMGITPHRYQLQCRIERAKMLLADRSIPLSRLAILVGFSSQSHFSTAFRKITGTTPYRYRTML